MSVLWPSSLKDTRRACPAQGRKGGRAVLHKAGQMGGSSEALKCGTCKTHPSPALPSPCCWLTFDHTCHVLDCRWKSCLLARDSRRGGAISSPPPPVSILLSAHIPPVSQQPWSVLPRRLPPPPRPARLLQGLPRQPFEATVAGAPEAQQTGTCRQPPPLAPCHGGGARAVFHGQSQRQKWGGGRLQEAALAKAQFGRSPVVRLTCTWKHFPTEPPRPGSPSLCPPPALRLLWLPLFHAPEADEHGGSFQRKRGCCLPTL